jgi:hypothetical protein
MKIKIIICLMVALLFVYVGSASAFTEDTNNSFFGTNAGEDNTTGFDNSFFGANAGANNTTGQGNTSIGYQAGFSNNGHNNIIIGSAAGNKITSGNFNTIIGYAAANRNTTGNDNTIIGYRAGYWNIIGERNVFIGNYAGYNETGSNKLFIDNSSTSAPLIYGEFDNNFMEVNGDLYITGNTYLDSDKRLKKDIKPIESSLDKILGLQGVSYKWKEQRIDDRQTSDRQHYGVIAQQVEEVIPEIVDNDKNQKKRVAYMELIPVLIEAMKEQQREQEKINQVQQEIIALS